MPSANDLRDVPPAQRCSTDQDEDKVSTFKNWAKVIETNVYKILQGPQRVSPEAAEDLRECIRLMKDTEDLAFDWDTSIYTNPGDLRAAPLYDSKTGSSFIDISQW